MSITSFVGIFDNDLGAQVARIEVPIFQRDYAQGRLDPDVSVIRERFVTALCAALRDGAEPLALDFVYGEVQPKDKTLVPLDGQQRLTTLFLLHWYLALLARAPIGDEAWTRFSYATRPSADFFCRALVTQSDPPGPDLPDGLSGWIQDQPWFLYTWHSDPTVRGMLVTLEAIHDKVNELLIDPSEAWTRLTGPNPAVWFHFRPIHDMGDETDLYIKVNSRGKPLTPFENLKARLETTIASTGRRAEFARKIDGDWSNLLWSMRRRPEPDTPARHHVTEHRDAHDRRFMRYLTFVTDICSWSSVGKDDQSPDRKDLSLEDWVDSVIRANLDANVELLFEAFDCWPAGDPATAFAMFQSEPTAHTSDEDRLTLFLEGTNLLKECCDNYDTNQFTLAQTLMLYAVIVDRSQPGSSESEFLRPARTLRNLIQATNIERSDMPELIAEVKKLIRTGELTSRTRFNPAQARQEAKKKKLLADRGDQELTAALFALEDHTLLRGSLAAFDLDTETSTFVRRADAFHQLFTSDVDWLGLCGAMLTYGDYGWQRSSIHRQYGSGNGVAPWRVLLTQNTLEDRLAETRRVLMELLDAAADQDDPRQFAGPHCARWVEARRDGRRFDWRYYFVSNPVMRTNTSGVFHLSGDGVIVRRLRPGQTHQASKQHDPYLVAIKQGLGPELAQRVTDPAEVWWVGIWLKVIDGQGAGIRSSRTGFALRLPRDVQPHFLELWNRAVPLAPCKPNNFPEADGSFRSTHRIRIKRAGTGIDSVDRISLGIDLMKVLIEAVDASASQHAPDGPSASPVNADPHSVPTTPAPL